MHRSGQTVFSGFRCPPSSRVSAGDTTHFASFFYPSTFSEVDIDALLITDLIPFQRIRVRWWLINSPPRRSKLNSWFRSFPRSFSSFLKTFSIFVCFLMSPLSGSRSRIYGRKREGITSWINERVEDVSYDIRRAKVSLHLNVFKQYFAKLVLTKSGFFLRANRIKKKPFSY